MSAETAAKMRLLLIEDSEADAQLLVRELERSGYEILSQRVDSEGAMREALTQPWDLITSDHVMPAFSAKRALTLAQELASDIPLIIVSGEIDLNLAVTLIKEGAADFVQKSELNRLPAAVERALRDSRARLASEAKWRIMFKSSRDAIGVSRAGIHVEANPAYLRMFGFRADEIPGLPVLNVIAPEERSRIQMYIKRRASGEDTPDLYETIGMRKDGSVFPFEINVATYELDGETFTLAHVRDITERRRSDAAVLASERQLRIVTDSMPAYIAHVDAATLKYTFVNKRFEEGFAAPRDQIVGRHVKDVIGEPNFEFALPYINAAREGRSISYENTFPLAEGVRWLHVSYVPTPAEGDTATGFILLAVDVTERKLSEIALQESEERYRRLLELAPDAVFIHQKGMFTYANRAGFALLGAGDPDQLLGTPIINRVHPDYREYVRERVAAALATGSFVPALEEVFIRLDGSLVAVEVTASAISYRNESAMMVLARDMTARKEAESAQRRLNDELEKRVRLRTSELQAAYEEMEAFAHTVSHDLRAPLRQMIGFVQILWEDYGNHDNPEVHAIVQRIQDAGAHMNQLIKALLELSLVGRGGFIRSTVSISQLSQRILTELRAQNPSRVVDTFVAENMVAEGDPNLVQTIIENLIGNAWKFTNKMTDARIEVGQFLELGERVFFVRDNGPGFEMADARRLFSPFQRLHRPEDFPGTGIGLASVQRSVRRHGGRVWAKSAPGSGATFFFTLPDERAPDE